MVVIVRHQMTIIIIIFSDDNVALQKGVTRILEGRDRHKKILVSKSFLYKYDIQSNLCTTTTLGTPKKWPLLTGGRCSEAIDVVKA